MPQQPHPGLTHRLATEDDLPALAALTDRAIAENLKPFLSAAQIEASRAIMGLDTALVADRTYFIIEDGAVELDRRAGAKRQIGIVGHHQSRCAVQASPHDLIAQDAVADVDLAGRRSHDADDLILDYRRFTDARLSMSGSGREPRSQAKRGDKKNAVTPVHCTTDR